MDKKTISPLKRIRIRCLDCAGSRGAVRKCPEVKCSLYACRMGKDPRRQGIGRVSNIKCKTSHSVGGFTQKKAIVGAVST